MPQLSESISRAILRVSDAAALQFESFSPEQKGCSSATLSLALARTLTLALTLTPTLSQRTATGANHRERGRRVGWRTGVLPPRAHLQPRWLG